MLLGGERFGKKNADFKRDDFTGGTGNDYP